MKRIMRLIKWIFRGINRVIRGSLRLVKKVLLSPFKVTLWSLVKTFRFIIRVRDKILRVVDKLESESQKWNKVFWLVKSPYKLMLTLGFSPAQATALLSASAMVGSGAAINELVIEEINFSSGSAGIYDAPAQEPIYYDEEEYNTLRIDLGTTPVREITIENVSLGTVFTGSALPQGETNVVQISGNVAASNFNGTRLEIGHLIFEKSRCKKLTLTDIQAHTLIVRGNASDGQSIAPSPGTSRMRAIGGGHHQAEALVTSGGLYDRIWIQAPNSGVNGKIGTLRLSNLYTKGGDCGLSRINAGTVEILLNEVGMGNGFTTKEFTISTTVTAANMTIEDNVEVTIAEPATT